MEQQKNNLAPWRVLGIDEFADYDNMGNLSQVQVGSQSVTYAYDTADRLILEENGPMGVDHHYEYDSSGNLTAVYTKTHGSAGWQSKESYTYRTENGQPTNQLLSITRSNLSGGSASSIFTAEEYDGVGNPCKYRGNVLQWKRGRILTGDEGTSAAMTKAKCARNDAEMGPHGLQ